MTRSSPLKAAAVLVGLVAANVLIAGPASAAVTTLTTTRSCVDGGGLTWHTKVVWGSTYVSGGVRKVTVDYGGWTSTLGSVATDSRVRSYSGSGKLVQTLSRTATVDYQQGTVYAGRNPANPPSGGARIEIRLGRDGDGFGDCTVTHSQSATAAPVVAAVGDMVCAPGFTVTAKTCQHQAVSGSILAARPAAFLALGDNQYGEGTLAQYRGAYHPSFGRFKAITSPAPGNHEYSTVGASGYFDYFGAAAGERARGYYSQDIGAWHVVSLNSERDLGATGRQLTWLKRDLAAHRNVCTLAVLHKPRFSSGDHGSNAAMKPFVDALVAARAELLLSGHDHDYERFAPQNGSGQATSAGVVQIVAGMGGKSLYGFPRTAANSVTRHNASFGWLRLTLKPTSADVRYVPVGAGAGTYSDQTTIGCR